VISRRLGLVLLGLLPFLFNANMIAAKATAGQIPPVALAFWRWAATALLVAVVFWRPLWAERAVLRAEAGRLFVLGAFGMGICGAFPYLGALTTTATNIGLIYAASPVLIGVLAAAFWGERMHPRQILGTAMALAGVLAVVARGDWGVVQALAFSVGDLWIVAAAIGWAVYSVLLGHWPTRLSIPARFAGTILGGLAALFPFMLAEGALSGPPVPDTRTLGPSVAGLSLYLAPLTNAGLAFLVLGEEPQRFHLAGAALVLPGMWLATRKPRARG
jgi:drug/metabolite transporter (DMT)-like permease